MSQLCISYSLATKLIGSFGVTISILMVNILVSDFFSAEEPDKFLATVESWTLFGLNWTYFMKNIQTYYQGQCILVCIVFYAGCSLFVNSMLCFASITERPNLVLPWIYMQIVNIVDQIFAIVVRLIDPNNKLFNKSSWSVPMSSSYLLISAYFLIIVCSARKNWINYPREIFISSITRSYENSQGSNLPKSPSYLSDQHFFVNLEKNPVKNLATNYGEV